MSFTIIFSMNRLTKTQLSVENLRSAIESIRGEAAASNIAYRVDLPERLECEADGETVNRLALHLINRAMNRMLLHAPCCAARISVQVEEFGGEFHLSVRDNSPVIDRLFASELSQAQFGEWYYEFDSREGNFVVMSLPISLAREPVWEHDLPLAS